MNNTQLAALAHRAGFGERTENQIHIEEFVKLKKFAEMVLAQRAWTGLTDEEMWNAYTGGSDIVNLDYAKAIQNKLKEKNT
jgi:hypothetical protein